MVLTPQLLQAIKLLQMPNLELTQFIENELASNPLLERAEERDEPSLEQVEPQADGFAEAAPEPGDWAREALGTDTGHLAANLGTEIENTFDADRTAPAIQSAPAEGLSANAWTGVGAGPEAGDAPDFEAYVAESVSLRDYLERQAAILLPDPAERIIGAALIDALDEAGYFVGSRVCMRTSTRSTCPTPAPSRSAMSAIEPMKYPASSSASISAAPMMRSAGSGSRIAA